jgi:uncharacterized protein YhaN
MSTISVSLNTALRNLTTKQEESDMAVVDKRTCVNRARAALQKAQNELERTLFEETKARDECVALINYLKGVPNGGTTAERQEQLRLSEQVSEMVERRRVGNLRVDACKKELDQAISDVEFAQSQHQRILDERLDLAERIARLPEN